MPPRKRTTAQADSTPDEPLVDVPTGEPAPVPEPVEEAQPDNPAAEDDTEQQPDANPEAPAASPQDSDSGEDGDSICLPCFPHGWPEDATSAGCEHGTWNRTI